jgi:hypothetical protein
VRFHSYVVARDFGFAPNPFFGTCTLATCKPVIRRTALIGDWIIGTGSKKGGRSLKLVFAMRVTETLTYDEYWSDARFSEKKPNLRGSKKQAFGDNIYHRAAEPTRNAWIQEDSHHSFSDGSPNPGNIANDTQTNRVLISADFAYWGGEGPMIPPEFAELYAGRGHRTNFTKDFRDEFVAWFRSMSTGYLGDPLDWSHTP